MTAKRHEVIPADRARLFSARLKSLNQQFAEWVKQQAASCAQQLWLDGVQHYQEYVADLLEEFKDIVGEDAQMSRQRDQATPGALFSTPVAAAAAAAGGGGSSTDNAAAAPGTGGSTGRRSVTWADGSTALTPAPGAAANGTPHPNTQNAGHTPAPANFGRFDAGTPSGSDMPTPQFKLPPSSNAGTPAETTPAARIMFGVINSGSTPAAAAAGDGDGGKAADAAAKTPAGSPGGFAFGSGGFGTPVTAQADASAKGKDSSPPVFAFGTPATSAVTADKPAAAADKGAGETRAFTFGTPAAGSSEAAAAAKKDTPTFGGFSADAAAGKGKDAGAGGGAAAPTFNFGVTPSLGAAASTSPGFSFGVAASSSAPAAGGSTGAAAATAAAGGDKGKTAGFSFGVVSSSNATAAGASTAPVVTFGTPSNAAAGGSSSTPAPAAGGFTFGVSSSSAATANTSSSSGAAAGSSPPAFAFGASTTPPLAFGAAGSTPAFGAAGSTPAFGASAFAGSTPGFGTPAATGFNFGAGSTPGGIFKFPAPTEAAGGGDGGDAAAGDAEEAEPQEEKTQVQRDERFSVLFSKVAVLNMAVKNEAGAWDWQNRGKGQMSVRKDTQTGKFYIFFNSEGQGKQLVMHELKAKDKPEGVPGSPAKVRLTLLNTLYTVKKEPGCQPEPVVQYERRMSIVRFANADAAEEFKTVVEQHKPSE